MLVFIGLSYGFYKHEVKFTLFSLVDFRFPNDEKELWENHLRVSMIKFAEEYVTKRD